MFNRGDQILQATEQTRAAERDLAKAIGADSAMVRTYPGDGEVEWRFTFEGYESVSDLLNILTTVTRRLESFAFSRAIKVDTDPPAHMSESGDPVGTHSGTVYVVFAIKETKKTDDE